LPSPPLAGDSSGNPVFVYQVRDTDAHGDIVAPDTNYELRVLLVPKDGTMKNALLPAVPFKTGSPVPTVIPVAIPDLEKYAITFLPLTETSKKADATPQIISRVQVQRPPTPATPATPAGDIIMEYRAFLLPKDVDQAIGAAPDDTVLLASLLALSSYKLPSPLPAGDSSGPPVFVYQVGDTDEHGDNVAPDTNYELRVLLVPKDGTMKRALLPAVPFRTGSPVPTMIPTPPAAQVVPPPSKEAPPSPAPGAVENKPGTAPVQATAPGAQPAAPASTGGEK
jgi:hypothetical protein